jgi:hypothetical protein
MKNIKRIIFSGAVLLSLFSVSIFAVTRVERRQKHVRRRPIVSKVVEPETFTKIPVSTEIPWEAIKIVILRDQQLIERVFGDATVKAFLSNFLNAQESFSGKSEISEMLLSRQPLTSSQLDHDIMWEDPQFRQVVGEVISRVIAAEPELRSGLYLASAALREKKAREEAVEVSEEEDSGRAIEEEVAQAEEERKIRREKIEASRAERERKIAGTEEVDERVSTEEASEKVSEKPATSEMEIQTDPEVEQPLAEDKEESRIEKKERLKREREERKQVLEEERAIEAEVFERKIQEAKEKKKLEKYKTEEEKEAERFARLTPQEQARERALKAYKETLSAEAARKEAELKTETARKSLALREKIEREKDEAEAKYELFKAQRKLANRIMKKDGKRAWKKLWLGRSLNKNQKRLAQQSAMEEAGKILGIEGAGEYKNLARRFSEAKKLRKKAKEKLGVPESKLREASAESAVFGMQKILPKEADKDPVQKLLSDLIKSPSTGSSDQLERLNKLFDGGLFGDSKYKKEVKTMRKEQFEQYKKESEENRRLQIGLQAKVLDKSLGTVFGASGYSEDMERQRKELAARRARVRLEQEEESLQRAESRVLGLQPASLTRTILRPSSLMSVISESHAKQESAYGRKADHIVKEDITVDVGSAQRAAFYAVYDVESFTFDKDSLYQTVIDAINSYGTDIENQVSNMLKQEFSAINFEIALIIDNQLYSFVKKTYSSIQHSKRSFSQGQTHFLVSSALAGVRTEIAGFARQTFSTDPAKEIKEKAIGGDFGQAVDGSFAVIVLKF